MRSFVFNDAEEANIYATEIGWRYVSKWEFLGAGKVKLWIKDEAYKRQEQGTQQGRIDEQRGFIK